MDPAKIQEQLIQSMREQQAVEQANLDTMRNLNQQQLNVANNATGTLFSSRPIFQGAQFAAEKYIPNWTKLTVGTEQNILNTQNTVSDALRNIEKLNNAAKELLG